MLTCAVNVSEGRRPEVLAALATAAGDDLLDLHADADHHRCVLTLAGETAVRAVSRVAVDLLDLATHAGAHPRMGVVDVVPFVPFGLATLGHADVARDRFARWLGDELGVPAFCYGRGRPNLPEIRRRAFVDLAPDAGPSRPHPRAGACAVGARPPLVAYNLWLARPDLARARALARSLRGPAVRALGLAVGNAVQVSCNLVEPDRVGPDQVYDVVAAEVAIARAELVGLVPAAVIAAVPAERWTQLDLSPERTVEARLAASGRGPAREGS